jgi:thiosulfate reductase cytochrome b subunit
MRIDCNQGIGTSKTDDLDYGCVQELLYRRSFPGSKNHGDIDLSCNQMVHGFFRWIVLELQLFYVEASQCEQPNRKRMGRAARAADRYSRIGLCAQNFLQAGATTKEPQWLVKQCAQ